MPVGRQLKPSIPIDNRNAAIIDLLTIDATHTMLIRMTASDREASLACVCDLRLHRSFSLHKMPLCVPTTSLIGICVSLPHCRPHEHPMRCPEHDGPSFTRLWQQRRALQTLFIY
ncbi:hypothetical protein KSP40_PGU004638 [Platanthera guangdongensis]|uniref:Uncharacterized protein n=1 Tax=Platanthera guangdongensis TaxID=2320717 RepID=A0ABR2LKW6_9ASPA